MVAGDDAPMVKSGGRLNEVMGFQETYNIDKFWAFYE